jgi:hypothetical protein
MAYRSETWRSTVMGLTIRNMCAGLFSIARVIIGKPISIIKVASIKPITTVTSDNSRKIIY